MVSSRTGVGLAVTGAVGVSLGAVAYWWGPRMLPALRRRSAGLSQRLFGGKAHPVMRPLAALGAPQTGLSVDPSRYPKTRRDPSVVDNLHGVRVADPYRWLEDPDSEETQAFVAVQNELTKEVLAQCTTREQFKEVFTALYDYPKFGAPFKKGDRYYYYHNSGLQQQYVLYTQASLDSQPALFFDPNTLSADGTVALSSMSWSDDGQLVAYSLSSGGSDWTTIHAMKVNPVGEVPSPLPDKLDFVKFSSMTWTHDNKGFFYNRYPDPKSRPADLGTETDTNTHQLLCYHTMDTPQADDPVIWANPSHPTWMMGGDVTDDGRYLVLYVHQGCLPANRVYVVDMHALDKDASGSVDWKKYDYHKGAKKLPVIKLVDDFSASYSLIANEGPIFYFMTNADAPRYRIVKVADVAAAGRPASWPDHVAQHPKDLLKGAVALQGDTLVTRYLHDVVGVLQLRSLSSGALVQELPMPGLGTVGGVSGDRKDSEFFFSFSSFTEPGAQYRVDVSKPGPVTAQLFRRTELKVPHDPNDYETKQVFVTSKDGTKVPMFITYRKGLKLDGSNPTLLYGYGGFNISMEPSFSASRLAFMRGYGGIFAQANLRGGGEYGTEWRNAGSCENKQNVFDDFQACAEFLIQEGYSSPAKLTIQGGSNGGLLVAACANQRPDLYACVLGQVGVMDMLRFHKFTIGHAWITDYGNPDKASDFETIYPYSPLHNVRLPEGGTRQYPAVLLSTGDHDDRVVPLHTLKLMATLQHELAASEAAAAAGTPQRNPLVVRVDVKAGHGAGKPTAKVIEETVDLYGFAAQVMGAKWNDPAAAKPAAKPAASAPAPAAAAAGVSAQ